MASGDIINPKRVRTQANERVDTIDAQAQSQEARDHLDAYARAVQANPRNVGGSSPTGLILQGFGLTLNPTAPNDNKVRIQSAVGVALDANGRMLIKENGITVDLTLPTGNSQVYAYYIEDTSDSATRRFISVAAPYTEVPGVIPTKFKSDVGFYTRTGDQTTILASDTVNGATTALCFLGVVNNTGGLVTTPGLPAYDPVSAPNGAYATNRLPSVLQPTTPPAANTAPGSIAHVVGLVHAALYGLGQAAWKGSDFLTPSAANNYGAYNVPAGGADKAFRQAMGYFTIGDGVTTFGDFNTNGYANSAALLTALVAAMPTQGGTILIKRGTQLTNFNAATFTFPATKTIEIVGEHNDVPNNLPQITLASTESFTVPSPGGKLVLRNLHIRFAATALFMSTGTVKVRDVYFESTATTDAGAAIQDAAGATSFTDLDMERVTFSSVQAAIRTTTGLVRVSNAAVASRVRILRVTHNNAQHEWGTIGIYNVGSQVEIGHIQYNWTLGSTSFTSGASVVDVNSSDNATNVLKRYIHDIALTAVTVNPQLNLINLNTMGHVLVERCYTRALAGGSILMASNPGPVTIERCTFEAVGSVNATGSVGDLVLRDCKFSGVWPAIGDGTSTIGTFVMEQCRMSGSPASSLLVQGTIVDTVVIDDNKWIGIQTINGSRDAMVQISGSTSIAHVSICNNNLRDILNSAYGGADATTVPSLFKVITPFGASIVCHDNKATKIDSGSSGNARMAPCLLECTWSANTASWLTIDVQGNDVGQGDLTGYTHCSLLRAVNFHILNHVICRNNNVYVGYDNGIVGQSTLDHLVSITTTNASGNLENVEFCDNYQALRQNAGNLSSIVIDYLHLQKGGGTDTLWSLQIIDNTFYVESSAPAFDLVNAFGIGIPSWAVRNMILDKCSAAHVSNTPGLLWFGVKFGSGCDNFNSTGGTLPASSVSFGSSICMYRV